MVLEPAIYFVSFGTIRVNRELKGNAHFMDNLGY
jgi:hypothetical protein